MVSFSSNDGSSWTTAATVAAWTWEYRLDADVYCKQQQFCRFQKDAINNRDALVRAREVNSHPAQSYHQQNASQNEKKRAKSCRIRRIKKEGDGRHECATQNAKSRVAIRNNEKRRG